jgi:nucleotide-binding universal stress UspA family protein
MDGSSLAECVLPHVFALASVFDARVTFIQVRSRPIQTGQLVDPLKWQMGKVEALNYLDGIANRFSSAGVKADYELLDGQAADTIIEYAHDKGINLIILSSHGLSGLSAWNVSGVVQKITQRAKLPTMIVRAYQPHASKLGELDYQTILMPLDLSQRAECAIPIASRLTRYFRGSLIVAHVVKFPEMPRRTPMTAEDDDLSKNLTERNRQEAVKYLEQIENRLRAKTVDVQTRLLLRDDISSTLHELVDQEKADLVVMSAHGYSGARKWPYGNIVEKFITYGSTPLLIYQDYQPGELGLTQAETVFNKHTGH